MKESPIKSLILRYSLLLLFGLGNLFIIYFIVSPLTIYPVFGALQSLYGAQLLQNSPTTVCDIATNYFPLKVVQNIACIKTTIFFKGYYANIIPACVAGSAYYLLLILSLTTPMNKRMRLKSLVFLIGSFLILNTLRIIIFAIIFSHKGFEIFDVAHAATWYFGSTVLVVLLWFSAVLIFKIKNIPVYTDFKMLLKRAKGEK